MLTPLSDLIPDAIIDVRYATAENITGVVLYEQAYPLLEETAAAQFVRAADYFRERQLHIVIWDAYRPADVQRQLRLVVGDNRYVREDSNHCRGLAVDITLAQVDGNYLDMGTEYDDFTVRAHIDADGLTEHQRANRVLLSQGMQTAGFAPYPYEWWHFDFVRQ